MANALHHRSDAFSGIVALVAIVSRLQSPVSTDIKQATTYFGFTLADPIGGLVVAGANSLHASRSS
jgi:divalent metal cation (Fe/Co/Zn/Cd) transporter